MRRSLMLAGGAAHLLVPGAALAEDQSRTDFHAPAPAEIVVTAPFQRDRRDILSGVAVLQGQALTQAIRPTIGETLSRTPGVSSTSFGPNASRPVLRGLQGERVRVLTDGIGSIDVSTTSVDHAVAINPLLAERIEVLRGPEALLYGSSAIGGVVNVIDRRIPRAIPTEGFHADGMGTYGSAANERSGAAALDVPFGRLVLHADGSYLKTGDLEIGGYALAPLARREALANAGREDEDQQAEGISFADNAGVRSRLPNSAARTWTAAGGVSLVTDTGHIGVAYSRYDSLYGVPVRFAVRPGQEQEGPRLSLKQDRVDGRAEVQTGGGILDTVRVRLAYASYQHAELEENGEVGTSFFNTGMEGRLELVQARRGAWRGATGGQYFAKDFNVVGEEAFLPKSATEQVGVFTTQQLDYGAFKVEAGGRYEHSRLTAKPLPDQPQFFGGERSFDTVSASGGASYGDGPWRIGANVSRTVRAPSAEELFSNGPHAGTESFEIGDPDFAKEKSFGAEAVLRSSGEAYSFEASIYHNWFTDFIYSAQTADVEDGLPVFQYFQSKARFYGFEAQGALTLARVGDAKFAIDGLADYVRARLVGAGPVPRIPPLRLLGGAGVTSNRIDARVEVEWSAKQDRVATFETRTDAFTLVNAQLAFRPWGAERPLSFILSANNILDVTARRHASVLKDFAPLPGRDLRITARATF